MHQAAEPLSSMQEALGPAPALGGGRAVMDTKSPAHTERETGNKTQRFIASIQASNFKRASGNS